MSSEAKCDDPVDLAGKDAVRSKDPKSYLNEMDARLEMCFLNAINYSLKKSELPLLASTFYQNHMMKYCPAGEHLEIKKSSYKTLSKFLKKQKKAGIIDVYMRSEEGGQCIVRVHSLQQDMPVLGATKAAKPKEKASATGTHPNTIGCGASASPAHADTTNAEIRAKVVVPRKLLHDECKVVPQEVSKEKISFYEKIQKKLRNALTITGISEQKHGEDIKALIIGLARDLKVDICREDIDRCDRIGKQRLGRKRTILVEFESMSARQNLFMKRRGLRKIEAWDGVYINEELTPYRQELSYHARQYLRAKLIKSTFTQEGDVFVIDNFGTKHMIKTSKELTMFGVLDRPEEKLGQL